MNLFKKLSSRGVVLPEDGCTVVGDLNLSLVPPHAPEDLVHAPGAEGGLDEVADGHGADITEFAYSGHDKITRPAMAQESPPNTITSTPII